MPIKTSTECQKTAKWPKTTSISFYQKGSNSQNSPRFNPTRKWCKATLQFVNKLKVIGMVWKQMVTNLTEESVRKLNFDPIAKIGIFSQKVAILLYFFHQKHLCVSSRCSLCKRSLKSNARLSRCTVTNEHLDGWTHKLKSKVGR